MKKRSNRTDPSLSIQISILTDLIQYLRREKRAKRMPKDAGIDIFQRSMSQGTFLSAAIAAWILCLGRKRIMQTWYEAIHAKKFFDAALIAALLGLGNKRIWGAYNCARLANQDAVAAKIAKAFGLHPSKT